MVILPFLSKPLPKLQHLDVHIWKTSLKQDLTSEEKLYPVLNSEEKTRAARYLVQAAKTSFIIARGTLRWLLAGYLDCQPQEIVFRQNPHGKLYLENSSLEFNLSHSHDLALFAFTLNRPIGVDIEFMRANLYEDDIARRFFSSAEVAALLALPENLRKCAFFNCWSRKEAFIKAVGVGIFYPLDKFDVAVDCDLTGEKQLNIHSGSERSKNWKLYALDIAPNYAAAVVTEGESKNFNLRIVGVNF